MGVCEVLTIVFVVCKLIGVISWSWWLVLLPEILAITFYVLMFVASIFGFRSVAKRMRKW